MKKTEIKDVRNLVDGYYWVKYPEQKPEIIRIYTSRYDGAMVFCFGYPDQVYLSPIRNPLTHPELENLEIFGPIPEPKPETWSSANHQEPQL